MYNSHYVPRLILRLFGDHFDLYDTGECVFHNGLTSVQAFFVQGLYDDDVENILTDELETNFNRLLPVLKGPQNQPPYSDAIAFFRKYLVVCYLRTPFFARHYDRNKWNDLLRDAVKNGPDVDYQSYAREECPSGWLRLFIDGNITTVRSDEDTEPFLISDKGLIFLDPQTAIYPYSQHEALWISKDNPKQGRVLNQDDVLTINGAILLQTYRCVGLPSLDKVIESILEYRSRCPSDTRFDKLVGMAEKLSSSENDHTLKLRKNIKIEDITIPSTIFHYIANGVTDDDIELLEKNKDYGTLSALVLLERYGVLNDSHSAKEAIERTLEDSEIENVLYRYNDHAESEFEKCSGVILLEIASERGNGFSSNRLYRYYSKGKHALKDPNKAAYYLQKGCEQGYGDCLVAFFKKIANDPDYESKISKYLDRLPYNGIVFLALADVYRIHGDEDNYLKWLEKSAKNGYTGAITRWLNYWINKEPLNLEKIELLNKRIINTQVDAAYVLADFYYEHQDLCPGKFEWFVNELKKKDNVFVRPICKKYNLPID